MKIYFIILLGLLVGAGFYLEFKANEIDPISKPRKISISKSSGTIHPLDPRKMNNHFSGAHHKYYLSNISWVSIILKSSLPKLTIT